MRGWKEKEEEYTHIRVRAFGGIAISAMKLKEGNRINVRREIVNDGYIDVNGIARTFFQ